MPLDRVAEGRVRGWTSGRDAATIRPWRTGAARIAARPNRRRRAAGSAAARAQPAPCVATSAVRSRSHTEARAAWISEGSRCAATSSAAAGDRSSVLVGRPPWATSPWSIRLGRHSASRAGSGPTPTP